MRAAAGGGALLSRSLSQQRGAAAAARAPPRASAAARQPSAADLKPPKASKPPTNLADKEGSPFHELGIKDVTDGMGRTRVRQHVNPLAARFQRPTPAVDWAAAYADPSLPLFVDLGCGPGRFLLLLARSHGREAPPRDMNYLGLEIRQQLVQRANHWAQELQLQGRVHYVFTNVSVSLADLLASYPGPVATMAAQFPDPQFKARHKKRRMVQASVVAAARERLMPGGQVFLQSDIWEAVSAMRDEFEQHAGDVLQLSPLHAQPGRVFHWSREQEAAALAAARQAQAQAKAQAKAQAQGHAVPAPAAAGEGELGDAPQHDGSSSEGGEAGGDAEGSGSDGDGDGFVSSWARGGWLLDNPLGVPTEREHYVASQGGRVFRVLLVKEPAE